MKHILVTTLNLEEALLNLALNNAPILFIIALSAWFGWWASRKFLKVEHRIEALEHRMERVEVRLDRIEIQVNEINHKLTALTAALIATGKISPTAL